MGVVDLKGEEDVAEYHDVVHERARKEGSNNVHEMHVYRYYVQCTNNTEYIIIMSCYISDRLLYKAAHIFYIAFSNNTAYLTVYIVLVDIIMI